MPHMYIKHGVFMYVRCSSCFCAVCYDCAGASLNSRSAVCTLQWEALTRRKPSLLLFPSGLFILKSVGVCCCVCASLLLLYSAGENKGVLALASPDCSH